MNAMKIPRLPNGSVLKIRQVDGALGGKMWPSAFALLSAIELGSGTGAVGIFAAGLLGIPNMILTEHRPPAVSVMTSVPYSVDGSLDLDVTEDGISNYYEQKSDRLLTLINENVKANASMFPSVDLLPRVMELDWSVMEHSQATVAAANQFRHRQSTGCTDDADNTRPQSMMANDGFELVLASDVTYTTHMHEPLANTIACLLSKKPSVLADKKVDRIDNATTINATAVKQPTCIIAHEERLVNLSGDDMHLLAFEDALKNAGLTIARQEPHPVASDGDRGKDHMVSILHVQHSRECNLHNNT